MRSIEHLYLMLLIFIKIFELLSNQINSQAQFQFLWFEYRNIWVYLQDCKCYNEYQQCLAKIEYFELEEK